jgi:RNA polymerase sigma-70 factor, ECF subfamily
MTSEHSRGLESSAASDTVLLSRFRGGQQDAAAAIFQRYALRLHKLAETQIGAGLGRRLDPEDIVQTVFRTFFRRTRCGQYEVPEGDELWKLLLVITLNKIRLSAAHHRAAKRNVGATFSLTNRDLPRNASAEEESHVELRMAVDDLLAELPPTQRAMVALRIDGYGVAEIATRTKRAKRSVERVLQNFRVRLAKLIVEDSPGLAGELEGFGSLDG